MKVEFPEGKVALSEFVLFQGPRLRESQHQVAGEPDERIGASDARNRRQ